MKGSPTVTSTEPLQDSTIADAYNIALTTLRDRYADNGIYAGASHFSDVWLRDSCFASWGSLEVGDYDIVRTNLVTNLDYMKENGQIPLRVGQKHFLLKYFGFDAKIPKGRYIEDKGISIPTDSNSHLIIVAYRYVEATQDMDFLNYYFKQLHRAMDWNFYMDKDKDFLIEEGPYAGWADSLKKTGKVLYTNVLHFEAVKSFSKLCAMAGHPTEAEHYLALSEKIKGQLNSLFWNGHFFIDFINEERHDYFTTDGNVLAVIFDLATPEQGLEIQKTIQKFHLSDGFTTLTNFPKYRAKHIYPLFFPINMTDYHNGLQWLWIGCVDAVSKHMVGMTEQAEKLIHAMAQKILEYDGVYEVYENYEPVKRLFYSSERWFAWSSGLFVYACKQIKLIK